MKKYLFIFLFCLTLQLQSSEDKMPPYLYKVLSMENWQTSKEQESIQLPSDDAAFIHFSREDQLARLITKYWSNAGEFVVLKIDTAKLPGKMIYEANPGSQNKYFHLYDGKIPLDAVVEVALNK